MRRNIYILILSIIASIICGCERHNFSEKELNKCKPVMTKGMKIDATNDYGTLTIIACKNSHRIISIKGMKNMNDVIIPARIRWDWKDKPEPVIGYKGSIDKFWDENRDVFVSQIDYFEDTVEYISIEEANADLKKLYDEWIERANARITDSKVYFNYAWQDNGLLVYWSIHQPEYWVIPTPHYIYLVIKQIYIDGKKPQGLVKCPYPNSELKVEYLSDEQLENVISVK